MEIIQNLSDMIEDEIDDAGKYAECAVRMKKDKPSLAETFYRIANEELVHMTLLHGQVSALIEDYRKNNGEPPSDMLRLYNILHKKHIEDVASVKGMLLLYKEPI